MQWCIKTAELKHDFSADIKIQLGGKTQEFLYFLSWFVEKNGEGWYFETITLKARFSFKQFKKLPAQFSKKKKWIRFRIQINPIQISSDPTRILKKQIESAKDQF